MQNKHIDELTQEGLTKLPVAQASASLPEAPVEFPAKPVEDAGACILFDTEPNTRPAVWVSSQCYSDRVVWRYYDSEQRLIHEATMSLEAYEKRKYI